MAVLVSSPIMVYFPPPSLCCDSSIVALNKLLRYGITFISVFHPWEPVTLRSPKASVCIFTKQITETPRLTEKLFYGRSGTVQFCMVKCVCVRKVNPVKMCAQCTRVWSAAAWLPCCQCYRPAVFFCQLRLIALSLSQRKILSTFQECYSSSFSTFFFYNYVTWNSPNRGDSVF